MKANTSGINKKYTRRAFAKDIWKNISCKYKPKEEPINDPAALAKQEKVREISAELSKQAGIRAPRIFFEDVSHTAQVMSIVGRARIRLDNGLINEKESMVRGILGHEFLHIKKMHNLKNVAAAFVLMTNFEEKPESWQVRVLSAMAKRQEYAADMFSARKNGIDAMIETLRLLVQKKKDPYEGGLFSPSLYQRLERMMQVKEKWEQK